MTLFFTPALAEALFNAIEDKKQGKAVSPWEAHERVKRMYTWTNVAERTEKVYNMVSAKPDRDLAARINKWVDLCYLSIRS